MLARIQPVTYSELRPYLFEDSGWIPRATMEYASQPNQRLYLTKSAQLSYEEELRLVIPANVKEGESARFFEPASAVHPGIFLQADGAAAGPEAKCRLLDFLGSETSSPCESHTAFQSQMYVRISQT